MAPLNYDRIPEELRWDKQWALAGPDETGRYKAPHGFNNHSIFNIKSTEPTHWRDLEAVLEASQIFTPCGIGYILSKEDKYTCIDLDVKNVHNYPNKVDHNGKPVEWTTPEQLDRFHKIIEYFDSYTERSASGQGYHIWVRGKIGAGCKRDGVEVYSQDRFIVCTGDVIVAKGIEARQEQLDLLVGEINAGKELKLDLVEIEQTESDEIILERARTADNSDKFNTLFSGNWEGYPSQSEADLSLMSMFTFYTKSNEQCRRLFRLSGLGQRKKATKDNRYLNHTLTIIRAREAREAEFDEIGAQAAAALAQQMMANEAIPPHLIMDDCDLPEPSLEVQETGDRSLPWPPGLAGEIARYIYDNAPRPVKEVAIVSTLGFLAGVCGKTYIYSDTGLNLYIVLVARSAVGKETMHLGIGNLIRCIGDSVPAVFTFVDFTDYASGPALSKIIAQNQCFVNVTGEWGRKLKRLAHEDGRDSAMASLRTMMTNLYQKSGPKSVVGGIGYSDKEKSVASVSGVAYSMIGETTPGTYFDALTDSMMEDGFLSRFTMIEYNGERPDLNKSRRELDETVLQALCDLVSHCADLNLRVTTQEVVASPEAEKMLDDFNDECDKHINSSEDEGYRQMYNRGHLKTLRISALLAAADNYITPVIYPQHVQWALMVVRKDIGLMNSRIRSGDVGTGDSTRIKKIMALIEKYFKEAPGPSYRIPEGMREAGIVPRSYLQIGTQKSTPFTTHKGGQNTALSITLHALIEMGQIAEVPKDKAMDKFKFSGKCYRLARPL